MPPRLHSGHHRIKANLQREPLTTSFFVCQGLALFVSCKMLVFSCSSLNFARASSFCILDTFLFIRLGIYKTPCCFAVTDSSSVIFNNMRQQRPPDLLLRKFAFWLRVGFPSCSQLASVLLAYSATYSLTRHLVYMLSALKP